MTNKLLILGMILAVCYGLYKLLSIWPTESIIAIGIIAVGIIIYWLKCLEN